MTCCNGTVCFTKLNKLAGKLKANHNLNLTLTKTKPKPKLKSTQKPKLKQITT